MADPLNLNTFAAGITDFIQKHNENYADIELAVNQSQAQISSLNAALSLQGQIDSRLNTINQIDNGSFEINQRTASGTPIYVASGTGAKTFVTDRWYVSGTLDQASTQADLTVTPEIFTPGVTPGFLSMSGTGTVHQDVRLEISQSIDINTSFNSILLSADLKTQSGIARLGFYDGFVEHFSADVVASGNFSRVTLNGVILGSTPTNQMRAMIQISGTDSVEVRRVMMSFGNLDEMPYSPLPKAIELQRCRRYYESGTYSVAGVGFSGTPGRMIDSRVRMVQKQIVPTVTVSPGIGMPGAGVVTGEDIGVDEFTLRLDDGDGTTGTGGMQVTDIPWTADSES